MTARLLENIEKYPVFPIFRRFFKLGLRAWGGPVAQIELLRRELVEDEAWVDAPRFARALAIYQALPGPEATELCVYLGSVRAGRSGAIAAGLGFLLPGFTLMLVCTLVYQRWGSGQTWMLALLAGAQPAVAAIIGCASVSLGRSMLHGRRALALAVLALLLQVLGMHFAITLLLSGLTWSLLKKDQWIPVVVVAPLLMIGTLIYRLTHHTSMMVTILDPSRIPVWASTFWVGLKSGLLTFGGAYSVITYLQHDAVKVHAWVSPQQFMDSLSMVNLLPTPLVMFATFIGTLAGGALGGLLITVGIFVPAFAFTLLGHETLERVSNIKPLQVFLEGVTIGVIGLIAATSIGIARLAVHSWLSAGVMLIGIIAISRYRSPWTPPLLIGLGVGLSLLRLWQL